ncbi:FMN-binding protein [Pelomicrobium methylotrophicum]|uniref:FMN-binding protein n=1 Tax=Pelomicrobium methylotrophicum TaxID=2602750 RepID=A0A5C7ER19_9PROT|nr:FMN-binding protein [Pelomicrobium methylotrophicum]TXF09957.1 FMN-binding protein [Pelomicrobium methylotrophicum]
MITGVCLRLIVIAVGLLTVAQAHARGVYQEPAAFIDEVFAGDPPVPKALWISGKAREGAERILGHPPPSLRVRYWQREKRTAWILEEIGKEQPITAGIVVDNGQIERVKVLVFRESRGWEVRYPFFTDQFKGTRLGADAALDRSIDGITGATLSVRALKKLVRLALFYHQWVSTDP